MPEHPRNDLLLFIGGGLLLGSILLGLAVGVVHVSTRRPTHFRYGTFYNVFALVGSAGMSLAYICFFFLYLRSTLAIALSIITLSVLAGLLLFAIRMKKDSRVLFTVLSFYTLFSIYLSPLFLWNLVYLVIAKKPAAPPAVPAQETAKV